MAKITWKTIEEIEADKNTPKPKTEQEKMKERLEATEQEKMKERLEATELALIELMMEG